jgi:hypothetical protein
MPFKSNDHAVFYADKGQEKVVLLYLPIHSVRHRSRQYPEPLYQRKKQHDHLVNGECDEAVNLTEESESADFAAKSAEVDAKSADSLSSVKLTASSHSPFTK